MFTSTCLPVFLALIFIPYVSAHACAWHPSMWGFNVTDAGNRPQDPLMDRTFDQWWFHNHLDHPPHPEDVLEFPAGGKTTVEITCDKGATSYWPTNPGGKVGDVEHGNDPCPGSPPSEYHTTNKTDVKGCAFAIAYIPPSQVHTIKPEDFTIFSVNQTCVWYRHTDFHVPAKMPACPPGGCTCAWFWIHAADSGSEQIYMNGYQCNITGATSTTPIAKPQVARRCGKETEPDRIGTKPESATNCTYGAKQPLYWDNLERNNMFEDPHHPPFYNDLYHYVDGAQEDIFTDAHLPSMTWAGAPTGVLKPVNGQFGAAPTGASSSSPPANAAPPKSEATPSPKAEPQQPKAAPSMAKPNPEAAPSSSPPSDSQSQPKSQGESPQPKPNSNTHPKGCKCHKCKAKHGNNNNKHGGKTVTVTHTVHPQATGQCVTKETKTISPEEASSIIAAAAAATAKSPGNYSTHSKRIRRRYSKVSRL